MKRALVAMISVLACNQAGAAVECSEKLTRIIVHTDDAVYFATDKTCAVSWCKVAMSTQNANTRSYAMMLAAQAQNKNLIFFWQNLSACTQANVAYAAPSYIVLAGT